MTTPGRLPRFVAEMVRQLRYRGVLLGVDDCVALRQALAAGFGWSDAAALGELCVALWAKSVREAEVVRAVFRQVNLEDWRLNDPVAGNSAPAPATDAAEPPAIGTPSPTARAASAPVTRPVSGLPAFLPDSVEPDPTLLLLPQYPLSERDVAQAWRRLRRPVRRGPPVELDVDATIRRCARTGVVTPPVLVPPRRNTARLLMLIDRQGSMTPYHGYVDHVRRAITDAARLDTTTVAYFHDIPGRSDDLSVLGHLEDPFSPRLDPILSLIPPLRRGRVYDDAGLTAPRPLTPLIRDVGPRTAVAIISDAGAARGRLDTLRLLDTLALIKALRGQLAAIAWLNPAPPARWPSSTAGQIARHVAMFPLTKAGMYRAVDVLRGRPAKVERPL